MGYIGSFSTKIETLIYWIFYKKAKTPLRASPEAAGLDLYSIETVVIPPGKVRIISKGIGGQIPPGDYGQLLTRSSMAVQGAVVPEGVIDADYQGKFKVVMINLCTDFTSPGPSSSVTFDSFVCC